MAYVGLQRAIPVLDLSLEAAVRSMDTAEAQKPIVGQDARALTEVALVSELRVESSSSIPHFPA
jgi:hypothetical protein